MATIGNLAIKLSANPQGFMQTISQAAARVQAFDKVGRGFKSGMEGIGSVAKTAVSKLSSFAGGVGSVVSAAAKLGGALTGAALAFGAFVKKCLSAQVGTIKLARSVGSSTEGLIALQHQVRSLGGNEDAAGRGLGILNERLSGLGPEGRHAEKVLSGLGLSLEELARMPDTSQAFTAIAEKIQAIDDPLRRAAAATALFGDQAAELLPALTQGKSGMDAAAAAATKLGTMFNTVNGSNIEDANTRLDEALDVLKGIGTQIAVQVAPWILAAVDHFKKLGETGWNVGEIVAKGAKIMAYGGAAVVEAWKGLRMVFEVIGIGFKTMGATFASGIAKMLEMGGKLPDAMGGQFFRDAAAGIKDESAKMWNDLDQSRAAFFDKWGSDQSAFSKVDGFFKNIEASANNAQQALESITKKTAGGAVQIANRLKGSLVNAPQIYAENMSPLEQFHAKMADLNQFLKQEGPDGWAAYARGASKALAELEKAHGLDKMTLPAGLTRDSVAAVSAVNQAENLNNRRLNMKPEDLANQIRKQALEIEKEQLKQMEEIAKALRKSPDVARIL